MSKNLRRSWATLPIVAAVLLGGVLAVQPAAANGWGGVENPDVNNTSVGVTSGRCAPMTSRRIAGTWRGQDGLALNGTIGFDMKDKDNRNIDAATGCVTGGYSTILQTNHYIRYSGARVGTLMQGYKYVPGTGPVLYPMGRVQDTWSISNIPANVTNVWVETYVRDYNGSVCGMPCAGTSSTSKYGWTNRRAVPLAASGQTTINLVAPLAASYGGNTGNLAVRVMRGSYPSTLPLCLPSTMRNCLQLYAWSAQAPEGRYLQGWGVVTRSLGGGRYLLQSLYAGQPFVARASIYDGNGKRRDFKGYTKVYRNYTTSLTITTT